MEMWSFSWWPEKARRKDHPYMREFHGAIMLPWWGGGNLLATVFGQQANCPLRMLYPAAWSTHDQPRKIELKNKHHNSKSWHEMPHDPQNYSSLPWCSDLDIGSVCGGNPSMCSSVKGEHGGVRPSNLFPFNVFVICMMTDKIIDSTYRYANTLWRYRSVGDISNTLWPSK